jgi:tetratricopeptide (TPR) repeat protein
VSTRDTAAALRRDQNSWLPPLLEQLQGAEREQAWERVEALCKQILQRDGENWPIWQRLALSFESRSDWNQAETLWRHLTQRFAQRPEPYLALAALQRQRGAPDAARVVLQQAERRLGSSAELAASLQVIDDPWAAQDAVPALQEGAAAAAVAAALQQAQGHLEAGRHAEAEAAFEQLVLARPEAVPFHRALAQLRQRRGDSAAVIDQLGPLLQPPLSPGPLLERLELPMLLVQALVDDNRWPELAALLPALVQLAPQDGRLVFLQARCALQAGHDLEALPLLQRSLQLAPSMAGAELALGQLLIRLNDWDGAIASLERAVALQPESQEAVPSLEQARRQQLWLRGEAALAKADWRSAEHHFRALLEFGDQPRALARLELLASLDPRELGLGDRSGLGSQGAAGLRLEQFSRLLDRLENQLPQL